MKINGLAVKTATKKLKITISKIDCAKGQTKDPGACAIARSLLRTVPGCTQARVHLGRTYLKLKDHWLRFNTPPSLRNEIIAFDRGGSFAPGDYELKPLHKSEREKLGRAHSLGAPKKGRPGHSRGPKHMVSGVRANGANR